MDLTNLFKDLDKIYDTIKSIEEKRELIIKGTRDINLLCSKAIVSIHNNKIDEADINIQKAHSLLLSYKENISTQLVKLLYVAEQELVEARFLLAIVQKQSIPLATEMNISAGSYVLGLLDSIGEMKRMIYDRLRQNRAQESIELFSLMQEMYNNLSPFAVFDNVIPGLRRKLDVNRMLLEDIRSLITEEYRRNEFVNNIQKIIENSKN